ncbi:hypothetical protein [Desulfosarcina variabilis]|uniref:hypothetical protein n=1 Tax=Desulfosarcina variabilis TaxID=2300 RepID=UPI003AFB28D4
MDPLDETAERLLKDLMEIMWFRGPFPEEGKAIEIIKKHLAIDGGITLNKSIPHRSNPLVNQPHDMVRVQMDMPRHTWRQLKKRLLCNFTQASEAAKRRRKSSL